jgi:acetyl esterase
MAASDTAAPWVDPELAAAGALLKERGLAAPGLGQAAIGDVRAGYDRIGAFLSGQSEPLAQERTLTLPGPHGAIPCRLYLPPSAQPGMAPVPALVYLHGGGFALGKLQGWDGLMRDLVRASGMAAVSVDYRLAPEHRFPVQFDETVAVLRHLAAQGATHGIDGSRLAAGGDSAGATLALAAACALRDAGLPNLRQLVLFYGVYSADMGSDSWRRLGSGRYGLSAAQMEWIWSHYLPDAALRSDWRAAPLRAPLAGLPPVFLAAASLDPLLDDSLALQGRLDAAGVANRLVIYEGINHGFIRYTPLLAAARRAVADAAAALRAGLAPDAS